MRISRHQMFMNIAEVAAQRSTCFRGNTGAVLVRDRNVLSIGYNGPPSGHDHCYGNACELKPDGGGCLRSVHAEINAIRRAPIQLVFEGCLQDCALYSTSCPCLKCAMEIMSMGIKIVFYRYPYRHQLGLEHLLQHGVAVYRITPSGMLITASGEIMGDVV